MKGKRFRRIQNGQIYEVIGREEIPGENPRWILWNDRIGKREFADDLRLKRQLGWELIAAPYQPNRALREAPSPLIKRANTD